MLVPAGVLVLVVLAAIAVDSAIAFMAHRELLNRAAGAANDAATAGLTDEQLQRGYLARPDPATVDRYVKNRVAGQTVAGYLITPADIETAVTDDTVTVSIEGDIDYVFAPAVPGARERVHLEGTSSAELQFRGP